jgi:predicted transcriptional regulator
MKRCTFMIEPDVLDRLESIAARTGLSKSEQIRQSIQWWLQSWEWPIRDERSASSPDPKRPPRVRKRRA